MRFSIVSVVAGALLSAGTARAGVVENFNVEDWGGLAYADDTTGKIANCSVYASNQKGAMLLFIRNEDASWFFSLTDDDWKLTPNSQYPVSYKIDGRRTVSAEAVALSDTQLGIYMAEDNPFFGQVRRGNRLSFTYEDETYPFDLSDSGLALDAAEACVERHKRQDAETTTTADESESDSTETAAASPEPAAPEPPAAEQDAAVAETPATEPSTAAEASPDDTSAINLPAFGNVEIETMEVPGWEAAAFSDADGAFTHCAIRAEYENGTTLAFARTADGSLIMALARADWSTEPGVWIPIKYSYKSGETPINVTGEAQSPAPGLLGVNMGKDVSLANDLKTTPEIVVEAEGKTLTFDITDIGPGLQAVEDCFEKHRPDPAASSSAKKKPSSSKKVSQATPATDAAEAPAADEPAVPAEPAAESGPADVKVEASDFTTALLARSGYSDHTMLTGDDVPESMRDRASAWQIGEIIGVTDIVGGTIPEIREQLESTDKKDCAGTFTHEMAAEEDGKAHVFSRCKSPTLNLNIHYVILPREADGFYLLSFIAFAEGSAVDSIAKKVFETARDT